MKSEVLDRFGSGLLLLAVLTIAVVASEAKPRLQDPAPVAEGFVLDADFRIAIDKIDDISTVFETALPIEIRFRIDELPTPRLYHSD